MQDRKRSFHIPGRWLPALVLIFTWALPVLSQKVPFVNYTIQNGLPQNTVNDIEQDSRGYIWFATQVGAARFDGYEFRYYNTSQGLPDNFVNCLLADSRGRLWMGTESGIGILEGERIRSIGVENGLVDKHVDRLAEDLSGRIWVATAYGISVVDGDSVVSHTAEDALHHNLVLDIVVDSGNRVHVATALGVTVFRDPWRFEKVFGDRVVRDVLEVSRGEIWYATQNGGIYVSREEGLKTLGYREGLTDEQVLCLMKDDRGGVWCGTYSEGLFRYEDRTFENVKLQPGYGQPYVIGMYQDSKGRIWVNTGQDGVWLLDGDRIRHLTQNDNLVHDHVVDIHEDRYGSIWFATLGGASRYGRVVFEVYDMESGLPDDYISSVQVDSRERVWFGTYGHLLLKEEKKISVMGERTGFRAQSLPLSFAEDRYRNVYIGTDRELAYHGGRSIRRILPGNSMLENNINTMLYSHREELWCGTDSGIVILKGNRVVRTIGRKDGLVHLQVNALDSGDGWICAATEGGVSVFGTDGRHLYTVTGADGLVSDVCIDIRAGPDGGVWVATNRGVSRIGKEDGRGQVQRSIRNYTLEQGLTSNTTYFVEFTDSTSLWIGTERGIDVLDTRSGSVEYFGYEEGFRPLETNARAVARSGDGGLWIGTIGGLVRYMPRYDLENPVPPDLILYPPLVDGKPFQPEAAPGREVKKDEGGDPIFPYKKNSLTFTYTGIHTTIPSRNRFSYLLEGFDDTWSEPGLERSCSYRNLPSGKYRFRLRAYNPDGVGVEEEAVFGFTIRPPFWKTAWFILLEVLLGLSLIYGLITYRERQLVREKRILEEKVRERTREIEDQKVEIEAQRDEISEQKRYVEAQRDQIAIQNKEITDSIHYAKSIQQAVLPGERALDGVLSGHFIFFRPRDIVSGDFYWVEQKEDRIIVCAADCTGHGVPGAFMSMLGLTFLNEIVSKDGVLKASRILDRLRASIIHALTHKEESSDSRDGMDVALVVIDPSTGTLEYAGAYNPLLLVRNGKLTEYKADKMPIGRHVGDERPFRGHRVTLEDGDMLYLFSDGYRDQFGGENGAKYKARPFKRLLQRISGEPVRRQLELIAGELDRWMGQRDQVDDILVMGIRYGQSGREPE